MSLKKLRDTAKAKATPPIARTAKRRERAKVQETLIQVREPRGTDPGQVETVYFVVNDGVLSITDERGVRDGSLKAFTLRESDNPIAIAKALVRDKMRDRFSGFSRPLFYEKFGAV